MSGLQPQAAARSQPDQQKVKPNALSGDTLITLLALAMGVRNATVRKLAVPDLTTTVLTMTLTGLAADSALFGGTGKGSARRTAAVIALLAGALVGGPLLQVSLAVPLAAATGIALLALLAYARPLDESSIYSFRPRLRRS